MDLHNQHTIVSRVVHYKKTSLQVDMWKYAITIQINMWFLNSLRWPNHFCYFDSSPWEQHNHGYPKDKSIEKAICLLRRTSLKYQSFTSMEKKGRSAIKLFLKRKYIETRTRTNNNRCHPTTAKSGAINHWGCSNTKQCIILYTQLN